MTAASQRFESTPDGSAQRLEIDRLAERRQVPLLDDAQVDRVPSSMLVKWIF